MASDDYVDWSTGVVGKGRDEGKEVTGWVLNFALHLHLLVG